MSQKKNKFEFSSEEIKTKYLNEVIAFFLDKRGEKIGMIAAEEVLAFFVETFGDEIYRKAVNDCKKVVKEKSAELDFELDMLMSE